MGGIIPLFRYSLLFLLVVLTCNIRIALADDELFAVGAVHNYCGNGFIYINSYLRFNEVSTSSFLFDEDTVINHIQGIDSAMRCGDSERVLYRVTSVISRFEPGQIFTDDGYLSCSKDPNLAARNRPGKKIYWRITVPKDIPQVDVNPMLLGNNYRCYDSEQEVILHRNQPIRIKNMVLNQAGTEMTIDAECVILENPYSKPQINKAIRKATQRTMAAQDFCPPSSDLQLHKNKSPCSNGPSLSGTLNSAGNIPIQGNCSVDLSTDRSRVTSGVKSCSMNANPSIQVSGTRKPGVVAGPISVGPKGSCGYRAGMAVGVGVGIVGSVGQCAVNHWLEGRANAGDICAQDILESQRSHNEIVNNLSMGKTADGEECSLLWSMLYQGVNVEHFMGM